MIERETHAHWIARSGREGCVGAADALFPYWSFTKTAISICALKLAEDGALDLDARLDGEPHTLRQLLAHTSGLPDYGQFAEYHAAVEANEIPWSREKLRDMALEKGPLFEPGQGWSYSNIGYMLAREFIEETTGKPLGGVVSELIREPLGLASIELAETREQFSRLHWKAAANYHPGWVYHGCLTGTASDAARLLHALFVGDLLPPDAFDRMLAVYTLGGALPGRPWERCGYALGLMTGVMTGAGAAMGHSGCGPFSVNAVYHFPDASDPITIACFTDGTNEGVAEFAAVALAREQ